MKVISVSKLVLVLNCSPESSLFAKLCEYVCIRSIEISFSRNTIFSERASTRHVEALSLKMVFLFLWFGMFDTGERVYTHTHTHTLLMLPKWAFQLNRIKKIQIYKLIENVNTIIL